jgi:predicted urease superfamily metal-dependent hydrolase
MTHLLEKYKAYLPADTGTCSSAKLQDRLIKHYAGSIVIHTQRGKGMSNLVFSDKLSLGDAGKYKSKFKASELENDFQVDVEQGQRFVHDKFCSKQTQLLEQIDLPLQLHTRSCMKSDGICPR